MDQSLLPNIYDFISHTYPFSKLNTLEKDAAATAVKIAYYSPDDELNDEQLAGAGLYMVRAGAAEEINKSDGSLRARLGAGDTFGYSQIDKTGKSDYKVTFLENTLLYFISKQVLQFLIDKNKTVGEYFNSKEWVRLSSTHNYVDESVNGMTTIGNKDVSSVCNPETVQVTPSTTIYETAKKIRDLHTEVALIVEDGKLEGIVTKSDITLRAVAEALDINEPISKIMTKKVNSIDASSSVFEAQVMMVMHNIKCLPVIKDGKIVGTVTTSQLLQNSQLQAVYLNKEIQLASSVEKLVELSKHNKEVFQTLVETNVQPHTIQKVMSKLADMYNQRLLKLAEEKFGQPPCSFAFVAAGSLARNEVQFLSDQDNAIITERMLSDKESNYFEALAEFVNTSLDKCGYALCEGHYMAVTPQWRVSFDEWTKYYESWIANTDQEAILNSSVFLDMRCLYGDEFLVTKLRQRLIELVSQNSRFLATLMSISAAVSPPIGTFRQFVLTKDGKNDPYFNIKKQAINLIVEMARIYGLSAKTTSCDTYERLETAVKNGQLKEDDYKELSEAYTFLNKVRFDHQLYTMKHGGKLSNNLSPQTLSLFERNHLRDAFRIIARHQQAALFRFAGGRGLF